MMQKMLKKEEEKRKKREEQEQKEAKFQADLNAVLSSSWARETLARGFQERKEEKWRRKKKKRRRKKPPKASSPRLPPAACAGTHLFGVCKGVRPGSLAEPGLRRSGAPLLGVPSLADSWAEAIDGLRFLLKLNLAEEGAGRGEEAETGGGVPVAPRSRW